MDPLSLLAGIAGVATAGIQVSKAIYDLASAIRGTPKEVSDIAREISDLSNTLSELRRTLKEGRELYRRKLLRRVSSAIQRIGQIHAEIHDMISGVEGFATLRWLFRRSKTTQLLYQIESHKNGINMILHIMTLAVQTRALLGRASNPSDLHVDSDGEDENVETGLLRQHAENSVRVSYQSLRNAVDGQGTRAQSFETDQPDETAAQPDGTQSTEVQLWREGSEGADVNTAQWLYELVFSSYAESLSSLPTRARSPDDDAPNMQLAVMVQRPVEVSLVVNELLAEWTTLTEGEIAGVVVEEGPVQVRAGVPPVRAEVPPLRFKDALGRKFSFPYHLVRTWTGIEEMIKQAFIDVDIIGPHVRAGHYDLLNSTKAVRPSAWEHVVLPGDVITMHMWPFGGFRSKTARFVQLLPNLGRKQPNKKRSTRKDWESRQ